MAGKYWREAATLMLIGKPHTRPIVKVPKSLLSKTPRANENFSSTGTYEADFNLLFLKRSSKSSFMPNTYVFPGGTIDDADKSLEWMSILRNHGYNEQNLLKQFSFSQGRPLLYSNKPENELLPELAFRICALRETFEETGVLLTSSSNGNCASDIHMEEHERQKWRILVQNDAKKFLELFANLKKLPAIFYLHEWDVWITPTWYKKKRFDTAFYVGFLDQEIPLYGCSKESEELKTETPYNLLRSYYSGELILEVPQIYQLGRLLQFDEYDKLQKFAQKRAKISFPRCLPVLFSTKDGFISTFPGDDLYPAEPDYIGVDEVRKGIDVTAKESRIAATHLNRMEFYQGKCNLLFSNITFDQSQIIPDVTKLQHLESDRSKL